MNFLHSTEFYLIPDSIVNGSIEFDTNSQKSSNLVIDPALSTKKINNKTGVKYSTQSQLDQHFSVPVKTSSLTDQQILADTIVNTVIDTVNNSVIKEPHHIFSYNINSDSFDYNYRIVFLKLNETKTYSAKDLKIIPHHYHRSQLNWTLIFGLISIIMLLSIKTYYQKILQHVINTLFNFQLADKMFKEKNILIRRAFLILNINFVIILSLFVLLLAITFGFSITNKQFLDYLIILSVIISTLFLRYLIFYLTGVLFLQLPVIMEYIHNKYLYNKNIGIALIPIVFTSIYISSSFSKILLTISVCLIVIITVFKIIRGFQIFLKNGVLLFYTILYLCTLELLPLVLGSKIIISLR